MSGKGKEIKLPPALAKLKGTKFKFTPKAIRAATTEALQGTESRQRRSKLKPTQVHNRTQPKDWVAFAKTLLVYAVLSQFTDDTVFEALNLRKARDKGKLEGYEKYFSCSEKGPNETILRVLKEVWGPTFKFPNCLNGWLGQCYKLAPDIMRSVGLMKPLASNR